MIDPISRFFKQKMRTTTKKEEDIKYSINIYNKHTHIHTKHTKILRRVSSWDDNYQAIKNNNNNNKIEEIHRSINRSIDSFETHLYHKSKSLYLSENKQEIKKKNKK